MKRAREMIKSYVLKQMLFSTDDVNARALKYFDLRTSAVLRFWKMNSYLRKAKAETYSNWCDFNVTLN
jgi:hypothetical protein